MQRPSKNFTWYEFDWQRPLSIDDVNGMLSHLASLTPRGYLAFEVRSRDGKIAYAIGTAPQYSGKIIELFHSHGEIEFNATPISRKPITLAKHLTVSKPILSLNTDVTASAIRSG